MSANEIAEVVRLLTPTGKLRVGLYLGSPLSLIEDPATGGRNGVGFELGRELARRLGVTYDPVVYKQNGEVIGALKAGDVDVLFTNATPARAKDIDFAALLKNATVVRTPNLDGGVELLATGQAEVFATNKTILFELAEKLPGAKVLDGRYGVEQIAMGIQKGKEPALAYARTFIAAVIAGGLVEAAAARARVRGANVVRSSA